MAGNYAVFRWLFSVHWRPVAWALNRLRPYPVMLEVEVTTACNLRCTMCERTYWDEPARHLSYEAFIRILDQFPGLRWIDITGIGEGLCHPRYLDMVREIKRRGIFLELYDPFVLWTPAVTDRMLDCGLNRIQPSVDAATKETYEKIRVGATWDVMLNNLRYLFREKERRGVRLPVVHFHYIVQRDNIHEMPAFVALVRSLAGRQRVGVQFTEILHAFPEIRALQTSITPERVAEVEEMGRAKGVEVWWNRNVATRPKADMRRCSLWLMPFIFGDGTVVPCCGLNESNARNRQWATGLGNIKEQPFGEIWEGERYQRMRRELRQGRVPAPCRGCPVFEAQ